MRAAVKIFLSIAIVFVLSQCASSRFVKTLDKNQKVVSFSFGGPIIKFAGAALPIPYTTFAYGYGLVEKATVYGSLHTTSLLFGNLQTDLGTTFNLFEKKEKFGFTASPALQIAYHIGSKGSFRTWPTLDLNSYFHFKAKKSYLYAGVNTWFELAQKRAHNEEQLQNIIPNIHIGYNVIKTKWQHQFELKYLAIGTPILPNVVDYVSISNQGSFGFYYSLIRYF